MLNKISRKMTSGLIKYVKDVRYDEEVYVYGFELVISTVLCWIAIIINAFLLSDVMSGIVFIIVFSSLRIFAGGYHADSYIKCFLMSNAFFVFLMMLKGLLSGIHILVWWGVFLMCVGYIGQNAPIINPKQPIGENKKKLCKKNIRYVLGIDVLVIFVYTILNQKMANMAILSIALVAVLMLISNNHKNTSRKEV
ncbi:MAG: accessory gene regulator B family protein [Tyzzerella sp.]|nr:accessory gene regulator B family protein [Tyzzerella sp.]